MKYILKGNEPRSLLEHKVQVGANYDNSPKEDIREALLEEQGNLCCYCLKRITKGDMKIEHWKPQHPYVELELVYKNMLGACYGNEGKPKHLQCCDTYKGNTEITINPLSTSCESFIKFTYDGRVVSDNVDINRDLNQTLNLNIQSIVNNRKSVIDGVMETLERKYPKQQWTKAIIQKELNKWDSKNPEGKYNEYCQVAVYYLKKRLQKVRA